MLKLKILVKPRHVGNLSLSFTQGCNWVISEEHQVLHFLGKRTGQQVSFCYAGKFTNFYRVFEYYIQILLGIITLCQLGSV